MAMVPDAMAKENGKPLGHQIKRIFVSGIPAGSLDVSLSGKEKHYVYHVLRKRKGDHLILFDGSAWQYQARIIEATPGKLKLRIYGKEKGTAESPVRIQLGVGLLKSQKMELVIQKTVETGAHEIHPVVTARAVPNLEADRASKKRERWQEIARQAARQCGRSSIPLIHEPAPFEQVLEKTSHADLCIIFSEETVSPFENIAVDRTAQPLRIALLTGPEGGFSPQEMEKAEKAGFVAASLGPRVLRAETAAILGVGLVQYRFGDLGS